MSESAVETTHAAIRGARRIAIIAIITSLSFTAVVGIFTLLTGEFGETQGKILLTTVLTAGFSIISLCHLAVTGRTLRVVGYTGIGVSVVAFILGIALIWEDWQNFNSWEVLGRAFMIFSILSISFAHANLLLLLGGRKRPVIRLGLLFTVASIALVSILIIIPILTDGDVPGENGDAYWRVFGVIAILDVFGTIVVPVTSRFILDEPRAGVAGAGVAVAGASITVQLSQELEAKLSATAAVRSTSREQVIIEALEQLPEPGSA